MISRRMQAFLAAFEECGCITRAAKAVDIRRERHYQSMASAEYREAFDQAEKRWFDKLEGAARQWASEGVEEAIFRTVKKVDAEGNETLERVQVGTKLRIPQSLVIKMLEAAKPDRYRTHQTIDVNDTRTGIASLSDAELEHIARGSGRGAAPPAHQPE